MGGSLYKYMCISFSPLNNNYNVVNRIIIIIITIYYFYTITITIYKR
jgi:hypothetical protein